MIKEVIKNILYDRKTKYFMLAILVILGLVIYEQLQQTEAPKETFPNEYIQPTPKLTFPTVAWVEPRADQKDISTTPTIKIAFEKKIKENEISLETVPAFNFSLKISPDGYYLTVSPKSPLEKNTKYQINVIFEKVRIYAWSFTTGSLEADAQIVKTIKSKLPYYGDHFSISYAGSTDKFFVTIDAKPVETYKKAALAWFTSQGLSNAETKINIFYYLVGNAAH
ncbi:MAG: hypothetical protein A2126_04240 [Candidatus Woykebacteria bacterium GWB1_45_5]|uniref:SbsA Ig-like domain-containing protein n=2 Tax=Candidatus Woykeibacteriota TaxID=1817899 RepID=A0A1G1W1J8_9BACT|nr:MAG: hypothetical protein A2113_02045 [Candidatus Woykebacteria bacterium GWA1_44_8]OGY22351.1 MAG: hypothetical protein A2126_04240 [Candidatus Woykebacteria bacterium GWB1_45_5]